ncbi:MAG TPA: hypothetical protein VFZ49_08700 [Pyrinomonadaceae bacterium]
MMEFFVGTVEWSTGPKSFLTVVWTWADHPGEAVHLILQAAKSNQIPDPVLIDLDYCDLEDLPDDAVEVGKHSFIDPSEYSFPTEYSYKFPHGVIPVRGGEDETDIDEIQPGYEVWKDDEGLINVEAVVERDRLFDVYMALVERLPSIRVFWIKLHEDWEEFGMEEIYASEDLNDVTCIRDFLKENWSDTVLNGHVTITTYADEGQTNLNISDHKMIVALTFDEEITKLCQSYFNELGLKQYDPLLSISGGVHHWHYRSVSGRDRKDLVKLLVEKGFVLFD